MDTTFQSSLNQVLKFEGGLVDNPNDPGGLTNLGVSQRAYPTLDVRSLTAETVAPLYEKDYWIPAGCPTISTPMDFLVFDCAVNEGVHVAVALYADNKTPTAFQLARLVRYTHDPHWPQFGHGWASRLIQGLGYCLERTYDISNRDSPVA